MAAANPPRLPLATDDAPRRLKQQRPSLASRDKPPSSWLYLAGLIEWLAEAGASLVTAKATKVARSDSSSGARDKYLSFVSMRRHHGKETRASERVKDTQKLAATVKRVAVQHLRATAIQAASTARQWACEISLG